MKTSNKALALLQRHRIAIACFAFVTLYNFFFATRCIPWRVDSITYDYHLVDYSFGFCSRFLPGAIYYGLFGSITSRAVASAYETVLILLFFAGMAAMLEAFLLRVAEPYRRGALILLLLYLTGGYTFSLYTKEFGMLDVYWLFFALIFFFVLEKKGLRFLIPLLYALCVMVHISSLLCFLILFSIVLLYQAADSEKKAPYFILFVLSLAVAFGLTAYFLATESRNLTHTPEEYWAEMERRGSSYGHYYGYSMYNSLIDGGFTVPESVLAIKNPVIRLLTLLWYRIQFMGILEEGSGNPKILILLEGILFLAPVCAVCYRFLFSLFRQLRQNRLKQLCLFFLMIQIPFTAFTGLFVSPDVNRWYAHAFLIFFTCLLFILNKEKDAAQAFYSRLDLLARQLPAQLYYLAYATVSFWAYG